jgi:hypothetical protein
MPGFVTSPAKSARQTPARWVSRACLLWAWREQISGKEARQEGEGNCSSTGQRCIYASVLHVADGSLSKLIVPLESG